MRRIDTARFIQQVANIEGARIGALRTIHRARQRRVGRHGGAYVIVFALCLVVLFGLIGMAIDLGQLYNRKAELQNVADGAARAAAKALNGSAAGITSAAAQARASAESNKYGYFRQAVVWSDAALTFSSAANGAAWLDVASAQAAPTGLLYAKVDTAALDAAHGSVVTAFMSVLSPSFAASTTASSAVAGRPSMALTPLAVCAQNISTPTSLAHGASPANAEQLEFGFRRGVGYNLMAPPPVGAGPQVFVIDPVERPGDACVDAHLSSAVVAPYMRSGTLLFDQLSATNTVYVSSGFPSTLTAALNTRFNQYGGATAQATMAAPDGNVAAYTPAAASWMATTPSTQTASVPPAATAWGVLWSYAIPLHFAAPHAAFTPTAADWSLLYPMSPAPPAPKTANYPASTPYRQIGGPYFLAPIANKPIASRRVLTIPLLNCTSAPPAAGTCQSAQVLGYGRFLMTVPADASGIYAEFGGAIDLAAAPSSATVVLVK